MTAITMIVIIMLLGLEMLTFIVYSPLDDSDVKRKNTILWLLVKWNIINIKDEETKKTIQSNMLQKKIFILPKKQKDEEKWNIVHKYHFEGRNVSK